MKRVLLPLMLMAVLLVTACERPPVQSTQIGYRGTGMEQVVNPRIAAAQAPLHAAPEVLPAASADGPKAGDIYKNVKVLGALSVGEFTRTMQAMTNWVSPEAGCGYCHNLQDLADDSKYQKVVSRRMLEMTRHINADWKAHVAGTGVTCYTCHRGHNVPEQTWFQEPAKRMAMVGYKPGQNAPAASVGVTSLPYDPFTTYLQNVDEIRVIGSSALPPARKGPGPSLKTTEATYGLMMHMSQSLGVNCTYCHNSRSFAAWDQSTPQRAVSWHGIRMVRDLNKDYLLPLTASFPPNRLGPGGDVAKVGCNTCHQGAFKPLKGVAMAPQYPALAAAP